MKYDRQTYEHRKIRAIYRVSPDLICRSLKYREKYELLCCNLSQVFILQTNFVRFMGKYRLRYYAPLSRNIEPHCLVRNGEVTI